jgi:tetratricopeptide (TPR) repeat protein
MKEERYVNIINIYQKREAMFSLLESPDLFLDAARACIHLDLQDMAAEAFEKADALLQDREKPSDLLFHLSMDLFEKGDLKNALTRLNLLIENHPSEKYVPHAYKIKGEILIDQKEYLQAAEMFSSALGYSQEPCERISIMLDKAKALMAINSKEEAAKAAREAGRFLGECHYPYPLSLRLGDLLLDLGYPYYAISIFAEAHETEKERDNRIRYKLAIAKGYEFLDKKDDSIAIYNQISGLKDPFWSELAEEKIREIDFDRKINEVGKNAK